MPDIRTTLFDFHGVLCKDRFYSLVAERYPSVHAWIDENIFRARHPILQDWMRGKIGFREVNGYIASEAMICADELDRLFIEGIREMVIDQVLLEYVDHVRARGMKAALVTDNMDIFTLVTVPHYGLGRHFDVIVNSADHGVMKEDDGGALFDVALEKLGEGDIARTMLVDDTPSKIDLFRSKGGNGHHFTAREAFLMKD